MMSLCALMWYSCCRCSVVAVRFALGVWCVSKSVLLSGLVGWTVTGMVSGLWSRIVCVCVSVWSLQASCSYPYAPDRLRWARTESDLTGHSINLHRRPLCPQLWSPFPLYVSFSFSISPFLLDSLDFHMEASQISHPLRTKRNTSCHDHWPKPLSHLWWPQHDPALPFSLVPYSHIHLQKYQTGCTM